MLRSGGGTGSFVVVDTVGADTLVYTDENLKALTVYEYAVLALDESANESSQATSVQVQSAGIKVPLGLQAVGGFRRVTLTWQASDEEDLRGYNV